VPEVPEGSSQTQPGEVPAIPEGGTVNGSYRITGRSDYRPGESGGSTAMAAAKEQTKAKERPWAVYLHLEAHRWIYRHREAADPTHCRKANLPMVPGGRRHLPITEGALCTAPVQEYPRPSRGSPSTQM
jgi:hypothetical protein